MRDNTNGCDTEGATLRSGVMRVCDSKEATLRGGTVKEELEMRRVPPYTASIHTYIACIIHFPHH